LRADRVLVQALGVVDQLGGFLLSLVTHVCLTTPGIEVLMQRFRRQRAFLQQLAPDLISPFSARRAR
jgi:hypothetical protein